MGRLVFYYFPVRPMSFSDAITRVLWYVPLGLEISVLAVMLSRQLTKVFPVFSCYIFIVVLRDLALLFLRYNTNLYSLVYWSGDGLAVLLSLGVILEVLQFLMRPFQSLIPLLRATWILGGIAALGAVGIYMLSSGGTGADRILESIVLAERAARLLQVFLLIVVIALLSRLGLTWHQYSIGIVAGFGLYSGLDLAVLEFGTYLHSLTNQHFVLLRPAAYNLAAIIWAGYFLPTRAENPVITLPHADLAGCNEALTDYVQQCYRRY
jgi:hypothetical protein